MPTVQEASKYVRSKSAGPFWMTVDIFCDNPEGFALFRNSNSLDEEAIARVFSAEPETVKLFFVSSLNVVKISVPRGQPQGHKYEKDMHCGQQYVKILDLPL